MKEQKNPYQVHAYMDVGFVVRNADGKACSNVYAAKSAATDYANYLFKKERDTQTKVKARA